MTAPGDVFPGDKSWEKDTTKRFLGKPLSNNGKGLLGTHAKVFITLFCFFSSEQKVVAFFDLLLRTKKCANFFYYGSKENVCFFCFFCSEQKIVSFLVFFCSEQKVLLFLIFLFRKKKFGTLDNTLAHFATLWLSIGTLWLSIDTLWLLIMLGLTNWF